MRTKKGADEKGVDEYSADDDDEENNFEETGDREEPPKEVVNVHAEDNFSDKEEFENEEGTLQTNDNEEAQAMMTQNLFKKLKQSL